MSDDIRRLRAALESLALAGDDIADMATAFISTGDVKSLTNYGRNIASIARAALRETAPQKQT